MATKHTDGCFRHAEDDEELFTLLARDPIAPLLVRQWAAYAVRTGQEQAKVTDALRVADKMDAWRKHRRPHKKALRSSVIDLLMMLVGRIQDLEKQLENARGQKRV